MKNCVLCSVTSVMIESVWKNLTGLQKGLDKSIGTPSLQENKALPNCANKENNVLVIVKIVFPPLLQEF